MIVVRMHLSVETHISKIYTKLWKQYTIYLLLKLPYIHGLKGMNLNIPISSLTFMIVKDLERFRWDTSVVFNPPDVLGVI